MPPPSTSAGMSAPAGRMRVSGPGHQRRISAVAVSEAAAATVGHTSASASMAMSGIRAGRPLSAYTRATAAASRRSHASPYTVSVGKAITPPAFTTTAARAQAYLRTEPYALLLADWDLGGGMAGDTLIVWAKKEQPGLKTVLFSNHPELDAVAAASGADAAFRKISGVDLLRQLIIRLAPA